MKLYWHPFSIFPRRVQIALREKQLAHEEVQVDLPGGALRDPAFRRLNPFGQVPVLEDGDVVIAESVAILEYLEERYPLPALLPKAPAARAAARQLMLWSGDYLAPAWKAWMAARLDASVPADDPAVLQGRDGVAAHLDVLETRLGGAAWLAGDYSFADVCYAPFVTVLELDLVGLGDLVRARPVVRDWIRRLAARPAVRDTAPASA
jgi:glutathione S-transferase